MFFGWQFNKLFLKFLQKNKGPKIVRTLLKRNIKVGVLFYYISRLITKLYSQAQIVLIQNG